MNTSLVLTDEFHYNHETEMRFNTTMKLIVVRVDNAGKKEWN